MSQLKLYNSLTRKKEIFKSITPGHVGMYVCGPTVSGESHLGHARPYVTFDVLYRYLQQLGNKVRYVRNITDAGHFEEEGRDGVKAGAGTFADEFNLDVLLNYLPHHQKKAKNLLPGFYNQKKYCCIH